MAITRDPRDNRLKDGYGYPVTVVTDENGAAVATGLPAALGANGGLKVEGVASGTPVPVSMGGVKRIEDCTLTATGEFAHASTITALVLPTITAKFVMFKARLANTGKVYVGLTGVTKADGTVDTTTGLELAAGDATPWIPCTNLNTFYRACDGATDSLLYWVLA